MTIPSLFMINGEAENGKDEVADWICSHFGLIKIALADPMKRFVRQLFNFPAENLWGPSAMRNAELEAVEFWRTAFSQLHTMHQFTVAVVPELYGPEVRAQAFQGLQDWFTAMRKQHSEKISARILLQTLGTEWGRHVSEDLWVRYLFETQLLLLAKGYTYRHDLGVRTNEEPGEPANGIVIPDMRFANELRAGQERDGYAIRVRRLSKVRRDGGNVGISGHKSELEQRGIPDHSFDKVFEFEEGLDKMYATLEAWTSTLGSASA